ncbi:hypothetical protein ACN4EE_17665 [Geminocystis sp. CENA526]|uniref:hypothetical protein n=1 Tax=Geminocystis sp. CENA526 TaxID=1355871 RepID=UPI003D6DC243
MKTPIYPDSIPQSGIYPPPTEEESIKVKKIMAEAKKRAKLNPAKNAQEAWEKLDKAIQEIRQDFLLKK